MVSALMRPLRTVAGMKDPMGDRFKDYEAQTRTAIPAGSFLVIRVDGRAFHTYTRGLQRPFDPELSAAMNAAAVALVEEVQGALIGYVQSDEISVVATDATSERAEHWFGGSVQKVASVAASCVTATFNAERAHLGGKPAMFDARVFAVPDAGEAGNYIRWRQNDALRNSTSMVAEHHLGSSAVHGKSTNQRLELLGDAGVDMNAFDLGFRMGRQIVRRETPDEPIRYFHKGEQVWKVVEGVTRHAWVAEAAARFDAGTVAELLGVRDVAA